MNPTDLDLREMIRGEVFALDGRASTEHRVGVEVEFIPVFSEDRRVVLPRVANGTGASLRAVCARLGGTESTAATGTPQFQLPNGGAFTFEPGGQIEYSSGVHNHLDGLFTSVANALSPLLTDLEDRGIVALSSGIDPLNPAEAAELALDSDRYVRMAKHLDQFGLAGRRMMRQTAAIHLNFEFGSRPLERWDIANRLAPFLIGIFANSPCYEGFPSGFRSFRAQQWRELDPARSGLVLGPDPVSAYHDFAMGAPVLFLGDVDESRRPLSYWIEQGNVDRKIWLRHLSTLFPEVRPRGYLELRGIDALDLADYAPPAVLCAGVLYDDEAGRAAAELLPDPTLEALAEAGRTGVHDPTFRAMAQDLWEISLAGARRLSHFIGPRSRSAAERFFAQYTARGLDPASDSDQSASIETAPARTDKMDWSSTELHAPSPSGSDATVTPSVPSGPCSV